MGQACLLLMLTGMMKNLRARTARWGCIAGFFILADRGLGATNATDAPVTREQLLLLQQQNELMQQQLQKQQQLIDSLTHKVAEIQDVNVRRDQELSDLKTEVKPGGETAP